MLGASRYYVPSIAAARAAGYYVVAVDRTENAPGFAAADEGALCDIIDRERVLELAARVGADGIVPLNDYGVPTAAFVAARLGLPGISERAAFWATDKWAMRQRWIAAGVPCPRIALARTPADFDCAADIVGFPCILKPAHGVGGASRGVIVVRTALELPEAITFSQSFYDDTDTIVESFVDADMEHSAEVIIAEGTPYVIAIGDKVKTPLPYRVDKAVLYPASLSTEQRESIEAVIKQAVLALDLTIGAAHVELASTAAGPVLFELGARCGGGGTPEPIVRYATGVDEVVEVVRILAGDRPLGVKPTLDRGCVYHFLTPPPGEIRSVHGLAEAKALPGVLDAEVFLGAGATVPEVRTGLHRAGYVIAGAATRTEAMRIARDAETRIEFEYASAAPSCPDGPPGDRIPLHISE